MKKIIHGAIMGLGTYEDHKENVIFCSFDKEKVENWVKKFNNIIKNNTKRITDYYNNDFNKMGDKELFWQENIVWNEPYAIIAEFPIR